jgi:hypothetical protein
LPFANSEDRLDELQRVAVDSQSIRIGNASG